MFFFYRIVGLRRAFEWPSFFGVALEFLLLGNESLIVISLNFSRSIVIIISLISQRRRSLGIAYVIQSLFSSLHSFVVGVRVLIAAITVAA